MTQSKVTYTVYVERIYSNIRHNIIRKKLYAEGYPAMRLLAVTSSVKLPNCPGVIYKWNTMSMAPPRIEFAVDDRILTFVNDELRFLTKV